MTRYISRRDVLVTGLTSVPMLGAGCLEDVPLAQEETTTLCSVSIYNRRDKSHTMTVEIRNNGEVVWRQSIDAEGARAREDGPDRYGGKTWTDELPLLEGDFVVRGRVDGEKWHSTRVSGGRSNASAVLLVYDKHGLTVGASKEENCTNRTKR